MEYGDYDLSIVTNAIMCNLKRYYTACVNDKACVEEVDRSISEKLIRNLERLITRFIANGEKVGLEKRVFNSNPILFFSGGVGEAMGAVGGYKIINPFLQELGYVLEGNYSRHEEGKNVLAMIDDFENLDVDSFVNKYQIGNYFKGTDEFVEYLLSNCYEDNLNIENKFFLSLKDKAKAEMLHFFLENPDAQQAYKCFFSGRGELYLKDNKVDKVGLLFECEEKNGRPYTKKCFLACYLGEYAHSFNINIFKVLHPWKCSLVLSEQLKYNIGKYLMCNFKKQEKNTDLER